MMDEGRRRRPHRSGGPGGSPRSFPDQTMTEPAYPVLVIGAGPAGLATAASLARRGIPYRLLERGDTLAYSWEPITLPS